MTNSHFAFLQFEWPELHGSAAKAEAMANTDARTACFYARRTLELAVAWLYRHDPALKLPYQDHLSALIHEPSFHALVGDTLHAKFRLIRELGNQAVHSTKPVRPYDAQTAVKELFHVCYWLGRNYARTAAGRPDLALRFDLSRLPKTSPVPAQTLAQLQKLSDELADKDTRLKAVMSGKAALDAELIQLRAEIADIKQQNAAQPDQHDYSEAQTRDYFIDLLLKEAGWPLDQARDREFPVKGMPNNTGEGFVDYVQWGDDGKPLGLLEVKRTQRSPMEGQQQSKLYADGLEADYGQRPVIFLSNGYEHWIWDDANYPPRPIQGFYKKAELELLIQRRITRQSLAIAEINSAIVDRHYQTRSIRRIGEAFEVHHQRKALVVMATGAGKTRTVVALADVLMRCNWAKRILFLSDRVALVKQAVNAFKAHLPASSPVNLVSEKNVEGRVYVSTYPTMMGLIDDARDGLRKFGVGHFDLVIIDEAHRSVYQKYGAIFDYFDSLLVGLTATPRDEIDRNTYRLFNLEPGVPTDVYEIDEAVRGGYLVPPVAISVPLQFQREGIRYQNLSEEEKDQWDALEWNEEGTVPDRVEAEAVNQWLFNIDTVDKVLAHVMLHGQKVAGGDRMGKTIIFAKNQAHADFIAERFNANYPHYQGTFARIISFKTEYAQSLIDDFSITNKEPHIAISVDMLDTGIDVPEVLNLVLFKLIRSKTKFWQMLGRGTRLCENIFGPDQPKKNFYVFDFCQNLEYFSQNPETIDAPISESLAKKLFTTRLEMVAELDKLTANPYPGAESQSDEFSRSLSEAEVNTLNPFGALRNSIAQRLQQEVAGMNLQNFIVRPRRLWVERFAEPKAWEKLEPIHFDELAHHLAGLPTELVDNDVEAKYFDLLMFKLQLALLRVEPGFNSLRERVQNIVRAMSEQDSIPMVRAEMPLIQEVMTDAFWEDVTAPMLDNVRRKLRALVKLIEKTKRKQVYSDFKDRVGEAVRVELPGFTEGNDYDRFRAKARQFLQTHENHITIHKLRRNEALTASDLAELERILMETGTATTQDIELAKQEANGLGLFIRALVGLDREAAKQAFNQFMTGKTLTANQIEFIDQIINHLTQQGWMDAALLYQSPYTDLSPYGVDGIFGTTEVDEIISILDNIRLRAAA